MAYQNQNNDNQVTTRGASSTSDKSAQTPILLLTSFQNDMLKLTFCNELPANQQTENKRFDRQNPTVTYIVRDKCFTLAEAFDETIRPQLPKIKTGEALPDAVSVPVGGVNQVGIKLGKNEQGEFYTALFLSKGIDPDTLKCDNTIEFVFPKGEFIAGYKPEEGTFGTREIRETGVEVFVDDLKKFVAASSKAYVHAARCVDKAYKDMMYDNIVSIGTKVGAPMKQNSGTGNSFTGNRASNPFDRAGNQSPMASTTMTLDELEQSISGGVSEGFMNIPDGDEELPFN